MSRRRGLARLVDPWAALLLGVLVALGVVILLATPGPWHEVVGPAAPVQLVKAPPGDIAVYVRAAAPRGRCTTVAWLHLEYDAPTSLTVVLVPPETQVPVEGGGFVPIGRLVSDVGASAATAGLADALQTPLGGWVVLSRDALRQVLSAARSPGPDRLGLPGFRQALTALHAPPLTVAGLTAQQRVLARVLAAVPYGLLNQAAVVNYVLGSAEVDTDLDLRVTSAVVRAMRTMKGGPVAVRTLPAIVERCGPALRWRPDRARAERLRLSLAYGLTPPRSLPVVSTRTCRPEVVVAAPAGTAGTAFAAALGRVLRREAAGPVAMTVERLPTGEAENAQLVDAVVRRRPLAVVVAPWLSESPSSASPSGGDVAGLLAALADAAQPAVVLTPSAELVAGTSGEITPAPLVVTPVASDRPTSTPQALARLTADTLVRSCWPGYFAPHLSGTRLGFSFAARRATTVALLTGDPAVEQRLARRLAAAGYGLRPMDPGAFDAPIKGSLIAHVPGTSRAALTLQGDVGSLLPGLAVGELLPVLLDESAPEPLTLVVTE